jgi:hypothetical protein
MEYSRKTRATSHVRAPIEITNSVMKALMRSVSETSIRDCTREEKIRAGLNRYRLKRFTEWRSSSSLRCSR